MAGTVRDRMLAMAAPAPSLAGGPIVPPQVTPEADATPPPGGPTPPADLRVELRAVPIHALHPDPENPRERLKNIGDLAASMEEIGLVQPIVVREHKGRLLIVAGHRRHAAAVRLGWEFVTVLVRPGIRVDEVLVAMLAENGQRDDLDPIEEARAIRRLMRDQKLATHAQVATRIGRPSSWVSGRLALLELPDKEQDMVRTGELGIIAAIARGRQLSGRATGTRDAAPWFGALHPLASKAKALCKATCKDTVTLPGGVACGSCWEQTIRRSATGEPARR